LKRRDVKAAINAGYVADDFITHNKERENDFADTQNILAEYARTLGFTLRDYKSFLSRNPSETVLRSDWYKDYRRWFENLTEIKKLRRDRKFLAKPEEEQAGIIEHRFFAESKAREKDKFEFFFLTYGQKTLIVRTPSKAKEEQRFLGYKISRKRGFEGIKLNKQNGKYQTALYDEDNLHNPEKINYLVRQMLLPELYDYQGNNSINAVALPAFLDKQARVISLADCLDFSRVEFEKQISLSIKKTGQQNHKWNLVRLGEVAEIYNGGTPDTNKPEYWDGGIPWATLVDTKNKYLYSTERSISAEGARNSNAVLLPVNTVIFSSRATIGEVTIAKIEVSTNQGYKNFVCNPDLINYEYLYLVLKQEAEDIADLASGMMFPEISKEQISNYKIPLPPLQKQQAIVKEIRAVEKVEAAAREKIKKTRKLISRKIESLKGNKYPIRLIAEINPSKTEIQLRDDDLVSFVEMASLSDKGFIQHRVDKPLREVSQGYTYFRNNDVIFAKITPCMENGKGAVADNLTNGVGFGSTEFFVLRANGKILPELLFRFTHDAEFRKEAERHMTGASGHRRVPKSFVENYEIPCPPIEEQKRIVAEIARLETQIAEAEKELLKFAEKKADILRKYL
jgi:type I restriction enzyme M protein